MTLFTIGYEGASVAQFWSTLREYNVEVLVDVRATPLSRKPGFSKGSLQKSASDFDIEYQHWSTMGCPRPILTSYRADKDWDAYTHRFWQYIRTCSEDAYALGQMAQTFRCALLCFESDPNFCHRSYVAQFASELTPGLQILPLYAHRTELPLSQTKIKAAQVLAV